MPRRFHWPSCSGSCSCLGAHSRGEGLIAGVRAVVAAAVRHLCLYHRFDWKPGTRQFLETTRPREYLSTDRRSYTPITVLALPHDKAVLLLSLVWIGAGLGIAFNVFWIGSPRWLYVPLYLLLGYASLAFIVDFFHANAAMMTLVPRRRHFLHDRRRDLRAQAPKSTSRGGDLQRDDTLLAFLCPAGAPHLVATARHSGLRAPPR